MDSTPSAKRPSASDEKTGSSSRSACGRSAARQSELSRSASPAIVCQSVAEPGRAWRNISCAAGPRWIAPLRRATFRQTLLEPGCQLLGPVGDDDVGPRALDRSEALERCLPFVEPSSRGGGLPHRILAAD